MGSLVKPRTGNEVSLVEINNIASTMIKSGLLPKDMTVETAVTIAIKGQELGIAPIQSLSEIYVIQGKAELKAELKLQLAAERIPGFRYDIIETNDKRCIIEYFKMGNTRPFRYEYTIEMANQAMFSKNEDKKWDNASKKYIKTGIISTKDQWEKQPALMLFYRNVSMALRMFAPEYKAINFQVFIPNIETANQAIEDLTGKRPEMSGEVIEGEFVVDSKTGEVVNQDACNCDSEQCPLPQEAPEEAKLEEVVAEENRIASEGLKLVCEDCGAKVTLQVAEYSFKKFGKEKCYNCQKSTK